jgi:sulfide:quinone oxidoreductase
MQQAVVLGAGFGGMAVVVWLRRLFHRSELDITVVDPESAMTYRPLLVHSFDRSPWTVARRCRVGLGPVWQRMAARHLADSAVGLDADRRQVFLASGRTVPYDVLFVAVGHENAWERVDGLSPRRGGVCEPFLARHGALSAQSLEAGEAVFALAPMVSNPTWTPSVTVGCECPILESAFLFDAWLRRRGRRQNWRLTVLTPAATLAESAGNEARTRLLERLAERDIRCLIGAKVAAVTERAVRLFGQPPVPYDLSVWMPPMAGPRWLQGHQLADAEGWVPTTSHMVHPDEPTVYAVGDVVSHPWPRMGHSAMVQARVAVRHYAARRRGQSPPAPFEPLLVWALEMGFGRGLLVLDNRFWGGRTHVLAEGRWPAWVKGLFDQAYLHWRTALPLMP